VSARDPGNGGVRPGDRERAVGAFVVLVAERGYQNVDLSEVSARAGLAPGSAERFYPDRLAYFDAGWDLLEDIYVARVVAAYRPYADWRDRLRVAARETAILLREYPKQAHYMAVDALSVGRKGRERQQDLATRLATFLDEARKELDDPGSAPATTSDWVVGIFYDRVYRYISSGREELFLRDLPELMFLAVSSYFGPEEGLAELDRTD
jgi:AcrR family transcriptional regulator